MKKDVPASFDGLISAARQDGPSFPELARLADETARRAEGFAPASSYSWIRLIGRPRTFAALATAVALGGLAAAYSFDGREADPPGRVEPSSEPAPAMSAPAAPDPPVQATTPDLPGRDVRSLPEAEPPARLRRGASRPTSAADPESVTEESLLRRAHAAISSNPREAVALTVEHARQFPSGVLAQEREVIAVEALSRLGRAGEARARAAALYATYPDSAYRQRVDDALRTATPSAPSSPEPR